METKMMQRTIKNEMGIKGLGLHTGEEISMRILPLPEDSGIIFSRSDLPGNPRIGAHISNLSDAQYALTLAEGGITITTVEHILGALAGMRIDNLLVEVDGPEVPILDGSALPFVKLITDAGIVEQAKEREYLSFQDAAWVVEGDRHLVFLPGEELRISYTIDYGHKMLGAQFASVVVDEETFIRDIAPARTFGFMKDVNDMKKKGLIKGASAKNVVPIEDDKFLVQLRSEKEFVFHKILDLIGDLNLLGQPLVGHIIVAKGGHTLDSKLAKKILQKMEEAKRGGLLVSARVEPDKEGLSIDAISHILPHRYPFLMIDRVLEWVEDKRIVAIKNVSINEWYFQGHFPGQPVMPGVLMLEGMAQAAGILMLRKGENLGKLIYFTGMDKIRLRRPVVPGDQLRLEVEVLRMRARIGVMKGQAFVGGKLAAEAEIMLSIVDPQ
ncbi:3-hydroxyacyl-[acyl-carrier-protein] dehydratase FabZ [Candidatus Desantisbacteria bacterium CG02_land_8_20_14_3_00_49_13]|nr:MAG: 3-hydroxyacyl-[acyl-carrier-protein] dehydratase FabZ [Candidatus Desantisbacteria bacterium CG02_land_8_20_14_3_00_49_13]